MALLFMDSVDLLDVAHLPERYDIVPGSDIVVPTTGGRFGGRAIQINDDNSFISKFIDGTPQTVIVSFAAFRVQTEAATDRILFFDNDTADGGIRIDNVPGSSFFSVNRGVTQLGTFDWPINAWTHFSIKWKADNAAAGTFDVFVNGVNVFTFAGDTINSGSATANAFRFGAGNTMDMFYDDIFICDDTGAAPFNDILADRRIDLIMPDAAGDSTQWAVTGAASNFDAVNEIPADDDTSYVEDAVSAQLDLYNMASLPSGISTIDGVQVTALARNPDGGSSGLILKVKTGAVEADSATFAPPTNYKYFADIFLVDPDTTVAWTVSGVNGMQAGVEVS